MTQAVLPTIPQKSPAAELSEAAWHLEQANRAYDKAFDQREEAAARLITLHSTMQGVLALVWALTQ